MLFSFLISCVILDEKEHKALLSSLQEEIVDTGVADSPPESTHYIDFGEYGCVQFNDPNYESGFLPVSNDKWILSVEIVDDFFTINDIIRRLIFIQRNKESIGLRSSPLEGYTFTYCNTLSLSTCISASFPWFPIDPGSRISLLFKGNQLSFWVNNTPYANLDVEREHIMVDTLESNLLFGCSNDPEDTLQRGYVGGMDELIMGGEVAYDALYTLLFEDETPPENLARAIESISREDLYYWSLGEEVIYSSFNSQIWSQFHDANGTTFDITFKGY